MYTTLLNYLHMNIKCVVQNDCHYKIISMNLLNVNLSINYYNK